MVPAVDGEAHEVVAEVDMEALEVRTVEDAEAEAVLVAVVEDLEAQVLVVLEAAGTYTHRTLDLISC